MTLVFTVIAYTDMGHVRWNRNRVVLAQSCAGAVPQIEQLRCA